LDLDIGAEALFKPAFALTRQGVSNYTLGVRDIREMPEANNRFGLCRDDLPNAGNCTQEND